MKTTEAFKNTIEQYVISVADSNPQFAAKAVNPKKNLDDCVTFVLNQVQKSGVNGFTDDEIYSMVIHYYEEDDIDIGNPVDCQVVVNHQVQLTEEEIAELKQKAKDKVFSDEVSRLRSSGRVQPTVKTVTPPSEVCDTLFAFD